MMHTLKYSLRTGRPRMLLHETDQERYSWDTEGAKVNANCRPGEGVLVGAPLPIIWKSGHPRMHEMQLMVSRATGKIPRHLHPEVRAFVFARLEGQRLLEVNDRYVCIDRKGRIVEAHNCDPACGDIAPNPMHRLVEYHGKDKRWTGLYVMEGLYLPTLLKAA